MASLKKCLVIGGGVKFSVDFYRSKICLRSRKCLALNRLASQLLRIYDVEKGVLYQNGHIPNCSDCCQ